MTAIKISKFLGEAPKISTENLPDTAAEYAFNTKLYSGDLIPFKQSSLSVALTKPGTIKTIYPMDDGSGGRIWCHWTTDVDVAQAASASNTTQRIYYTGDGEPRVTNYTMAINGGTAYPMTYYTLGLPTPTTAPTASATSFTTLTISTRARDSGNTATIVTSAAHGLNSGAYVTITLAADTTFNLTNAQITVVNPTTFTYYCPGAAVVATADAACRVDLAGATQIRTYVYTWLTAWGEESVPSAASAQLYMKEGQSVSISGLPAAWPGSYTGTYQTTGMKLRLYRTVSSASGSAYYKVADISLGTTTYTDTAATNTLVTILPSLYYDQPPSGLKGIKAIHNGIMVGFFDNTVCFSEPGQPHAWPVKYQQSLDSDVVAVETVGQTIVVLTEKNPWVIQGTTPAVMSKTRMDYALTCTSKRGVVNMGYGLVFPTPGGLAVYSASSGGDLLTKSVHSWDTWQAEVDPYTIVAKYYNGQYIATSDKGTFVFERNDQIGGYLVELSQAFTAGYYDQLAAEFFYVDGDSVYLWDDPNEPNGQLDWKSKTMIAKEFVNLGAARVLADYGLSESDLLIVVQNNAIIASNQAAVASGALYGAWGTAPYGGGNTQALGNSAIRPMIPVNAGLTFELYVNKQLVFRRQITDDGTFRLPTGYRHDTFAVRVYGNLRVRSIHLAETPYGLKQV